MDTEPQNNDQPASDRINPVANAIKATILAVVLVSVATALYVYFSRPAPISSGSVGRVSAAPMPIERQTEEGTDIPVTIQDQLLVFAQIHVQNLSDKTLVVQDITADMLENGTTTTSTKDPNVTTTTTRRSTAASGRDYQRVFDLFPQFSAYKTDPVLADTKIAPHQSIDGTVIFSYPISQQQWDLRRGLVIHVEFDNNTTLSIQAP